jgi:hypothetical protein
VLYPRRRHGRRSLVPAGIHGPTGRATTLRRVVCQEPATRQGLAHLSGQLKCHIARVQVGRCILAEDILLRSTQVPMRAGAPRQSVEELLGRLQVAGSMRCAEHWSGSSGIRCHGRNSDLIAAANDESRHPHRDGLCVLAGIVGLTQRADIADRVSTGSEERHCVVNRYDMVASGASRGSPVPAAARTMCEAREKGEPLGARVAQA